MFASYEWNDEGTDAVRAPDEGVPAAAEVGSGRMHSIPSIADCRACHDTRRTEILGFNALQLSTDRDPQAIHGEPLAPEMVTLRTLVEEQRLRPARTELVANPPRIRTDSAATRAVLGYMAANCGGCHNRDGELASLGPSLKHGDVAADGDAVARSLVRHTTAWQVPGLAEGAGVLIDPDAPASSAILTRMRSRRPSSQMPPVGNRGPGSRGHGGDHALDQHGAAVRALTTLRVASGFPPPPRRALAVRFRGPPWRDLAVARSAKAGSRTAADTGYATSMWRLPGGSRPKR